MVSLAKSYGPLLKISMRCLTLGDSVDGLAPEVMSLNELGIQSLEQATLAANVWIDECLRTCVDDMFEGLDQIALLCFQAAQEAKKHTWESDKSEISRYRV